MPSQMAAHLGTGEERQHWFMHKAEKKKNNQVTSENTDKQSAEDQDKTHRITSKGIGYTI
jgi:hypothetical protein